MKSKFFLLILVCAAVLGIRAAWFTNPAPTREIAVGVTEIPEGRVENEREAFPIGMNEENSEAFAFRNEETPKPIEIEATARSAEVSASAPTRRISGTKKLRRAIQPSR